MNYSLNVIEDKKFNTISLVFLLRQPLSIENATKNTLLPQILKNYKSVRLVNQILEDIYGASFYADVLKKGNEQIIEFYIEVLENYFEDAINFLNEIIFNPPVENNAFNNKIFIEEKNNLRNSIISRINDKKIYAKNRCLEEMFKGTSLGIYADGSLDKLDEITPSSLYSHYITLISASVVDIFIVGNISKKNALSSLKLCFPLDSEVSLCKSDFSISDFYHSENLIVENKSVAQAKLCMGYRSSFQSTGDKYYSLLLANEILGGSGNSRLFSTIREKSGMCYYISALLYRFSSSIIIQCGIENNTYEKTVKLIKEEINNLTQGNFTTTEFENSKQALISRFSSISDFPSSIIDFSLAKIMLNDTLSINEIIRIISNITKEQVVLAFNSLSLDTIYILEGKSNE